PSCASSTAKPASRRPFATKAAIVTSSSTTRARIVDQDYRSAGQRASGLIFVEAREAAAVDALAPLAGDLARRVQAGRALVVAETGRGLSRPAARSSRGQRHDTEPTRSGPSQRTFPGSSGHRAGREEPRRKGLTAFRTTRDAGLARDAGRPIRPHSWRLRDGRTHRRLRERKAARSRGSTALRRPESRVIYMRYGV